MHSRLIRILLALILALGCLGAGFGIGYLRGFTAAKYDDTVVGLQTYLSLYRFEQQGDTNRMADRIRFMIFGYSHYYDRNFSHKAVTSEALRKDLAEARIIASEEVTNVVSIDSVDGGVSTK